MKRTTDFKEFLNKIFRVQWIIIGLGVFLSIFNLNDSVDFELLIYQSIGIIALGVIFQKLFFFIAYRVGMDRIYDNMKNK